MRRLLLIVSCFISISLYAKSDMLITPNKDGTQTIRIPLNYESKNVSQGYLRGSRAEHTFSLPIASRWVILSAKAKLDYTPSLAIVPARSVITVSLNDKTVSQQSINMSRQGSETTLETSLPADKFEKFNRITVNGYQHYNTDQCEDETAPELWTKIDIEKSYVELTVLPKTLPNELSSIDHYLFDFKNISRQRITFVLPEKRTKSMATGAVVAASTIGKKLKYRDVDFNVASKIPSDSDTVIIATRQELISLLTPLFSNNRTLIASQVAQSSILFFSNPANPHYGIICLTGDNDADLVSASQAFASYDFALFKGNGVKISNLSLPNESEPYSAPGYLLTGKHISFRELGQKNTTFKYMYPAPQDLNFKMYPDLYFDEKEKIKINVNGIFPVKVRHDSVLNVTLNNNFATQFDLKDHASKEVGISKFFNFKKSDTFPVYLIGKGKNKLSLQPAMVPFKKGNCELYNMENLQATILDNSYIELPDAPHWIEMPYIRYFLYAAYPFSIHPDGLSSGFLLESFSSSNLKAALKIAFFLGREIEYPLYRATVTTSLNDLKDKEIVYIGSYQKLTDSLFKNAQVKVSENRFTASFPSVYKYVDYLPFYHTDRLEPFQYKKALSESGKAGKHLLVQVFRSPFEKSRSVLSLQYDDPESLEKGVNMLFSSEQEVGWNSDTLIIDTELQKINSFELAQKYFIGDLSFFDRIRFYATQNIFVFGIVSLLLILVMAYVIRRLLEHFKRTHHPHV